MALTPFDPTGGHGATYARALMARQGPTAVRCLQAATRTAVLAIRNNPRMIRAMMRTGSGRALRAAGLTGVESGITCVSMETTAVAGGSALLSEIILPVAIACVAIYVVHACVGQWQTLPSVQSGIGQMTLDNFQAFDIGSLIKSDEFGAPAQSAYMMLSSRSLPDWTQGI